MNDYKDVSKTFFGSIEVILANNPDVTKIELFATDKAWEEIKKIPNLFHKGGHLYCEYKNKVLLIKRLKIREPEGYKTVKFEKIKNTKLLESKIWEKMLAEGSLEPIGEPFKVEWKAFEWKK